jgi:hypothetical protein
VVLLFLRVNGYLGIPSTVLCGSVFDLFSNRETLYANVNSIMAIEPEEVRLRVIFDPDDDAYTTVVADILFYNQVEIN